MVTSWQPGGLQISNTRGPSVIGVDLWKILVSNKILGAKVFNKYEIIGVSQLLGGALARAAPQSLRLFR